MLSPAGGSALEALTARQGEAPTGLTTFGLSFQWAGFSKQLSGSDSVDSSGTDRLDATIFDLAMWRHFKGGFSAGLQLPIGTVRLEPEGGTAANVSGFGDLQVGGAYTFNAPFGGVWRPRIRLRTTLALPTGTARRVEDASPGVPPNLIAIGTGAIGLGGDAAATQPVAEKLAARVTLGFRAPVTFSETGNRFGWSATAGLGLIYQPKTKVTVSGGLLALHRDNTRNRETGDLINSGGDSIGAELGIAYLATDSLAVGINGHLPLYQDVNGTQIAQSFALMSFVGVSFGEGEHEHGDEHAEHAKTEDDHGSGEEAHDHGSAEKAHDHAGDEKAHDHAGDEKAHDHGSAEKAHDHAGDEKAHDHAGDEKAHDHGSAEKAHDHAGAEKAHDHAGAAKAHDRGGAARKKRHKPDVAVLARGGASFALSRARVPGKLVAIDFWADWCKPCKGIEAILVAHAGKTADFAVRKVEVPTPRSKAAIDHLGGQIRLPTVWLVDKSGSVVEKLEGVSEAQLRRALQRKR